MSETLKKELELEVENQENTTDDTSLRREILPLMAMRGLVLFPKMILHFDVGREKSIRAVNKAMSADRKIYLVAQKDLAVENPEISDLYTVGVVAKIRQVIKSSDNIIRVLVEGLYRAKVCDIIQNEPYISVICDEYQVKEPKVKNSMMTQALMRSVKSLFDEYCMLMPKMPKEIITTAMTAEDPDYLVEYIICNIPIDHQQKQQVLEEMDLLKRMELTAQILEKENSLLDLERDIYERVKESMDKNQKEYYLREQMRAISQELGEEEDVQDEAARYKETILSLKLEPQTEEKLLKEVARLSKMPSGSQESAVIRGYLDNVLELPWNKKTKDRVDLKRAEKILERDHYGLKEVKKRILEFLAVRKLAPDVKGQIICLYGPPGVGKTSIARSIAESLGRQYVRVSLGGVRDESDIRGHRKTYIGAMPGRIINAIKQAQSNNPLILLDEIDKMGNDFRGDPSSAMLEVLDSEQNSSFRDHYIEVPFDLSDVMFITTANTLDTIPAPLRDRMEIITLSSYTREEKFQIAKRHLIPKQMKRHGVTSNSLRISDDAVYAIIDSYTRESGVRTLERTIASLCRKAAKKLVDKECKRVTITDKNITDYLGAKKFTPDMIDECDEVGTVNGLAWTSVGGEMLKVETLILEGSGKIQLTGSLGDVMKESAQIAVSYVRSRAKQFGIDTEFYKKNDIHIHFPEGAVPKDGPSAGITITTALVSALTGIPVRRDVAMTGEISLRGNVMPIGGLKEKTMAAYRAGVKTVIIPKLNVPDLDEVDDVVKKAVKFVPSAYMDDVLAVALTRMPNSAESDKGDESDPKDEGSQEKSLQPIPPRVNNSQETIRQ